MRVRFRSAVLLFTACGALILGCSSLRYYAQAVRGGGSLLLSRRHELVPAFAALLAQEGGQMAAFYDAARELTHLPEAARAARLVALQSSSPTRTPPLPREGGGHR